MNAHHTPIDKPGDLAANETREALHDMTGRRLAPLFTWMTGLAPTSAPPARRSEAGRIAGAVAAWLLGLLAGALAAAAGGGALALLPFAWTLAVGAARDLQLTIFHHAAHGTVISERASRIIGFAIGAALMIEPFRLYAPKHRRAHHGRQTVSTQMDPTVTFLLEVVGLRPGAPKAANWRRILWALISPRVHLTMLAARIRAAFGRPARPAERLAAAAALVLLIGGAAAIGGVGAVALGVAAPMTIGYQAAQILRLAVEHRWPAAEPDPGAAGQEASGAPSRDPKAGPGRSRAAHDALTVAIRCAPRPPAGWTAGRTTRWTAGGRAASALRFAGATALNAWIRWTVLPGDSGPSHHWHHGEAQGDWANHVAAAARWEARRRAAGAAPHDEAWGVVEAFDMALDSYERASWDSLAAPAPRRTADDGAAAVAETQTLEAQTVEAQTSEAGR